jgi:hypothetical protein
VKERLVRSAKEAALGAEEVRALLLDGSVVGSRLGGESSVLVRVLNIDEVNLHAALGLNTNDQRRTLTGGNDLMGVVDGFNEQTVGALELLDHGLGKLGEADARVVIVKVLCKLGDALGIGLGLELEALSSQQGLELLVVGDDAIVDNGELPVGVRAVKGVRNQL